VENIDLVKNAYQLFSEGDVPGVLELFDAEIEWNECSGFPFIEGDGISIGPDAVAKEVFSQLPIHYDGFNIEIDELFGCGEKVVMVGYYKGVWKGTGKEFKANATHVWTVKDQKLTKFFQAVDTAKIINE
jgi:ketosteroid isomerase-like protein